LTAIVPLLSIVTLPLPEVPTMPTASPG